MFFPINLAHVDITGWDVFIATLQSRIRILTIRPLPKEFHFFDHFLSEGLTEERPPEDIGARLGNILQRYALSAHRTVVLVNILFLPILFLQLSLHIFKPSTTHQRVREDFPQIIVQMVYRCVIAIDKIPVRVFIHNIHKYILLPQVGGEDHIDFRGLVQLHRRIDITHLIQHLSLHQIDAVNVRDIPYTPMKYTALKLELIKSTYFFTPLTMSR